ncbi:MAG: glycine--tRNA ligase subunit beta [Acidobacteria bacterium]|nr:glycine--tRNA ligase subunit beta [Acidobacteriota bacterium]
MSVELILEVGCEEIPARYVESTLGQLQQKLTDTLQEHSLAHDAIQSFATPRRLLLVAAHLEVQQPDRTEIVTGPPQSAAFDAANNPTNAARGFAAKHYLTLDQLQCLQTEKGVYLGFEKRISGKTAFELLARDLPVLLGSLDFPKSMRWEPSRFLFVRPIRWILCRLGAEIVPFTVAGVTADGFTYGHRILSGNDRFEVASFASYKLEILNRKVRFDAQDRLERIRLDLDSEAETQGAKVLPDPKLLNLVVHLNEFPSVVCGCFAEDFLRLPKEVLVTVMREHQKYFSLVDGAGRLLPRFLAVVDSDGSHAAQIRAGHERVLKARLADASFFWDVDRKVTLEGRVARLERVIFQQKLGTMQEKTQRLVALAGFVGQALRVSNLDELRQAARLCKADLTTDMVKEFTDLQGIMGGLYARAEEHPTAVADAIYEHYRPATLDDAAPETMGGAILSVVDKLDSVVGAFAIGQVPTGSKDPLALRRQTLGLTKVLLDKEISISLEKIFRKSFSLFKKKATRSYAETWQDVAVFVKDRLRYIFKEQGFRYDEINSVVEIAFDNPFDCLERLRAIASLRSSADFEVVAQGFKRIKNILPKPGLEVAGELQLDDSLFEFEEERQLYADISKLRPKVRRAARSGNYARAFELMASLRPTIDRFFDRVLVMAEEPRVRANRLSLLASLLQTFLAIADVSEIVAGAKEA